MGRSLQSKGTKHGAVATGLAMAGNGVVGTTTKFSGDKKSNKVNSDAGSDGFKTVGNVGQAKHKTAKAKAGVVGACKASGSNY